MKIKQKLIPAIAMLVISAIALTTASLAWFSMTTTAEVTSLSITAAAPSNIYIKSVYGATANDRAFTDNSIALDIVGQDAANGNKYVVGGNLLPLMPVSSNTGLNTALNSNFIFATSTTGAAITTATKVTADSYAHLDANGQKDSLFYIDVPLTFVTTGSSAVNLNLDYSNTTVQVEGVNATLAKAVRIAVLNSDASAKATDTPATYVYANTDDETLTYAYFDEEDALTAGEPTTYFTNDTRVAIVPTGTTSSEGITVTFRIWFEGEDSNCIAANAGNTVAVKLAFVDAAVGA